MHFDQVSRARAASSCGASSALEGGLLYSRVVGFLARASQALLMALEHRHDAAACRMQVYVDDPAITMAGSVTQRLESVNCLLAFWLCMGFRWLGGRAC